MKNFCVLLCLPLLFCLPVFGQHSLKKELNSPHLGDSYIKEEIEYQPVIETLARGRKQVLDLSKRKTVPLRKKIDFMTPSGIKEQGIEEKEEYRVDYYSGPSELFVSSENHSLNHYCLSGDSLLDYGRERQGVCIRYHVPGLVMLYPVSEGYHSVSSFHGRGLH